MMDVYLDGICTGYTFEAARNGRNGTYYKASKNFINQILRNQPSTVRGGGKKSEDFFPPQKQNSGSIGVSRY